jgi:hypothetical protein
MPHSQKKEAQKMKTHAQNRAAKAAGVKAPPTEEELEHRRKVNIENEKKKAAKAEAAKRRLRELEAIGGLDGLLEKVVRENGILKKKNSAKSRSMFKNM